MNRLKVRRLKNKFSNNKIKIILIVLTIFVFMLGSAYALLNQNFKISGTTTIGDESIKCDINVVGSLSVASTWADNEIIDLTITNNTGETINGFIIKMKVPLDTKIKAYDGFESNGEEYITPNADGIVTLETLEVSGMEWFYMFQPGDKKIQLHLTIPGITTGNPILPEWITFNGCKVYGSGTITPDPDVPLTGLEISPKEYTMTVGETAPLNVIKTPSNADADIKWSSSDNSVVSVSSSGQITALKEGTAIITAKSGDISATSTITVNANINPPTTDGVEFVYSMPNTWGDVNNGYSADFTIKITNNTDNNINSIKFTLGMPSGMKYTIWTGNTSIDGNDFTYSYTLNKGESVTIYGQFKMPAGYEINDYKNPNITNIIVN